MSKDARSSIYNILAFQFAGQDTADQTVKEIRVSGVLEGFKIVAQVIVEQDATGKVHVHETGKGGMGAALGAVGGGLLSLIGGPSACWHGWLAAQWSAAWRASTWDARLPRAI